MKTMNTPRTRMEFERNFHLLHRQIEDGRLRFAQGVSFTLDGLARVRFLPNGRIDFLSVDEMARLQANMTAQFDEEFLEGMLKGSKAKEQKPDAEEGDKPKP
jgi:hypothetical protein